MLTLHKVLKNIGDVYNPNPDLKFQEILLDTDNPDLLN